MATAAPTLARALVLAAAVLAAPAAAQAALPAGNLVVNPGAEGGQGAGNASATIPPPSWTATGALTAVQYGASGFPTPAVSDAIGGGANFFAGGNAAISTGEQVYDLSAAASDIDAGSVSANLSGHLGGFSTHDDNAVVTAAFLDPSGASLGSVSIGPVTAADRAGEPEQTTLLPRTAAANVPAGTRSIRLTLTATRAAGSYNDGYADNLSLTLIAPPELGRTANAEAATGQVLVKLPNKSGFIRLEEATQIPVGSVFDTKKGSVRLTTAADSTGTKEQEGVFGGGRFSLGQTRKNPLVTLSMTGGGLRGCKTRVPRGGAAKPTAQAAASRRRTLFGNARGRFRTRGRNSSATVRGTIWRMTDTCAGTLTTVQRGSVKVRDFRLRKNKVVRAGGRYLARAGRKNRR